MTRKTYPDIKEGVEMAELLETSAEYLVTGVEMEILRDEEQVLISAYRQLDREDKENLSLTVKAWLQKRSYLV